MVNLGGLHQDFILIHESLDSEHGDAVIDQKTVVLLIMDTCMQVVLLTQYANTHMYERTWKMTVLQTHTEVIQTQVHRYYVIGEIIGISLEPTTIMYSVRQSMKQQTGLMPKEKYSTIFLTTALSYTNITTMNNY